MYRFIAPPRIPFGLNGPTSKLSYSTSYIRHSYNIVGGAQESLTAWPYVRQLRDTPEFRRMKLTIDEHVRYLKQNSCLSR